MSKKHPYFICVPDTGSNRKPSETATEIMLSVKPSKNDLIIALGMVLRVKEVIIDEPNDKVWVACTVHTDSSGLWINPGGQIIRG